MGKSHPIVLLKLKTAIFEITEPTIVIAPSTSSSELEILGSELHLTNLKRQRSHRYILTETR